MDGLRPSQESPSCCGRRRIPACLSGRKNVQVAGFVPGAQSDDCSRGIISFRLPCSPQKNAPLAFREAILFRVCFGDGGQRIAIKARSPQQPFCGSSPSGYAFLSTMDTKIHRARIARETLSRDAADGKENLPRRNTARRPVVFLGAKR